jgi:hypothetical protein
MFSSFEEDLQIVKSEIDAIPLRDRKKMQDSFCRNPKVLERLAKRIVVDCFRNQGTLENIHAGIFPSSATGDFEDVKVVTPYGEIPWNRLSRISDEEMMAMNKTAVNRVYQYISGFATGRLFALCSKLKDIDLLMSWDSPDEEEINWPNASLVMTSWVKPR